jgi:hypothetical protein
MEKILDFIFDRVFGVLFLVVAGGFWLALIIFLASVVAGG